MDIIWSDKFKTGINSIDEQHKFIVEALSGIQTSKMAKAEVFQLLIDLQAYIPLHFATEEKYMLDSEYPEYLSHKANHDKVLDDTKHILSQSSEDKNPSEVALEMVKYMADWFVGHYSDEDVKMVEYLRQHGPKI